MRALALWAALLIAGGCYEGIHAARAVTEAAALACARASDGTDGSIADCYTERGLAVPSDL